MTAGFSAGPQLFKSSAMVANCSRAASRGGRVEPGVVLQGPAGSGEQRVDLLAGLGLRSELRHVTLDSF